MGMAGKLYIADDTICWTDKKRQAFYKSIAPLGVGLKYEHLIHRPRVFAYASQVVVPTTEATIAVMYAQQAGIWNILYDAKLFGNPDALAKAMRGIGKMGVWACTFDAGMPSKNISAIVENAGAVRPCGVTVLSSYDDDDCINEFSRLRERVALDRAWKLCRNKVNLLVCTGMELRQFAERGILKNADAVVVGVRQLGDRVHDHAPGNIVTPTYAMRNGATHLVVGRPIMDAPDPVAAAEKFIDEMETAAANRAEI